MNTNQTAQDFSRRLRVALREAGVRISAACVAHEFNLRYWGTGISSHAARNWLMGVSVPKQDKLRVLAEWLHVTPEGLLFGTQPARAAQGLPSQEPINLVDQQLISHYFELAPKHRVTVRVMVDALRALDHQRAQQEETA